MARAKWSGTVSLCELLHPIQPGLPSWIGPHTEEKLPGVKSKLSRTGTTAVKEREDPDKGEAYFPKLHPTVSPILRVFNTLWPWHPSHQVRRSLSSPTPPGIWTEFCDKLNQQSMAKVTLGDFWDQILQCHTLPSTLPSRDASSWNPAATLWESPNSPTGRGHVYVF